MKVVKQYLDAFAAECAKGMLENEGIQAVVMHATQPFAGISPKLSIDLMVNDEDYGRAKKLVDATSSAE